MTPQIIISLDPNGEIVCELPGFMGTRRKIEMKPGEVEDTIRRILAGLLDAKAEIGLDGAPTQAQVNHWERHSIWPGAGCRFCIAEGRFINSGTGGRKSREVVMKRSDGVEVRKILPKVSGVKKAKRPKAVVVIEGSKSARLKNPADLDL